MGDGCPSQGLACRTVSAVTRATGRDEITLPHQSNGSIESQLRGLCTSGQEWFDIDPFFPYGSKELPGDSAVGAIAELADSRGILFDHVHATIDGLHPAEQKVEVLSENEREGAGKLLAQRARGFEVSSPGDPVDFGDRGFRSRDMFDDMTHIDEIETGLGIVRNRLQIPCSEFHVLAQIEAGRPLGIVIGKLVHGMSHARIRVMTPADLEDPVREIRSLSDSQAFHGGEVGTYWIVSGKTRNGRAITSWIVPAQGSTFVVEVPFEQS